MAGTMLRWTLLTSAVASASFVGTLVFSPAVVSLGERFAIGQAATEVVSAPPAQAAVADPCRSPLAKIVAALRRETCR
jgi:hypothetical protein